MGIFFTYFITFERSLKKMLLLKVVLDQLYQLMVFETPDHFFQRSIPFRQNYKINTNIQDMYII